jgi:uncharacterized protein YbaP (TraB family)
MGTLASKIMAIRVSMGKNTKNILCGTLHVMEKNFNPLQALVGERPGITGRTGQNDEALFVA